MSRLPSGSRSRRRRGKRGAEVRFTTDGTAPTAESPLYADPMQIDESTVVRAAIFRSGKLMSVESRATFTKAP
ncbi:MAG: chitobiase/beta-hexosaminidase C-terminal domain-containing protein [Verrucomicrobiales bacterium]